MCSSSIVIYFFYFCFVSLVSLLFFFLFTNYRVVKLWEVVIWQITHLSIFYDLKKKKREKNNNNQNGRSHRYRWLVYVNIYVYNKYNTSKDPHRPYENYELINSHAQILSLCFRNHRMLLRYIHWCASTSEESTK